MADAVAIRQQQLPFPEESDFSAGMAGHLFAFLMPTGDAIPPHWSRTRDAWLRDFWLRTDPVKNAVNTFVSKATSVPVRIMARNQSIKRHVAQAADFEYALTVQSGIMRGWRNEFEKFIVDYLTQDNGAFMLVLGPGPASGPIVGAASGVYSLDSSFCTRTGDAVYPILYQHEDGEEYKIHYSRLISQVKLPSPRRALRGVGLCPVSCCVDASVELKDIAIMSQEKFGSRPARRLMYARKGATIEQLRAAIDHFDTKLDNQGLTRFAKTLLLAPKTAGQELDLQVLDMIGPHDGFNRMDVHLIDLGTIANAFGLDMMDLGAIYGISGSSKSQEVVDRKGRGKGVNDVLDHIEDELDSKFLPPHLTVSFDNVDDQQDEHQANIRSLRATARERDLRNAVTTPRIERMLMRRRGEITEEEFEELEMFDGRQPDGTDLLLLFESEDAVTMALLTLPLNDPTNVEANDPATAVDACREQIKVVWKVVDSARAPDIARTARFCLAALERLLSQYEGAKQKVEAEAAALAVQAVNADVSNQIAQQDAVSGQDRGTPRQSEIGGTSEQTKQFARNGVDKHF